MNEFHMFNSTFQMGDLFLLTRKDLLIRNEPLQPNNIRYGHIMFAIDKKVFDERKKEKLVILLKSTKGKLFKLKYDSRTKLATLPNVK